MRFEIYRQRGLSMLANAGGEWRWRLKGANGEIIAQGESYTTKDNCVHAVKLIMETNYMTPIVEV